MKKLLALFMVSLFFSPVIAHAGEHSQNESSSFDDQHVEKSGFNQLYPEYRSGMIWVVAEVLIVVGAAFLAGRHYFQKSEYGSIKGFIRERLL